MDRRASSDSGDSSGWTSSALSTTDDLSTDSPTDRDNDYGAAAAAGLTLGSASAAAIAATKSGTGGGGVGLSGRGSKGFGIGAGVGVGGRLGVEAVEMNSKRLEEREGIIAESRRIARWAWRQSHFVGTQDTPCACTYHPPRKSMVFCVRLYKRVYGLCLCKRVCVSMCL